MLYPEHSEGSLSLKRIGGTVIKQKFLAFILMYSVGLLFLPDDC